MLFKIHIAISEAPLRVHLGVGLVVVLLTAHAPPLILRDTIELQDRKASNFFRVFLEAHANRARLRVFVCVCVF